MLRIQLICTGRLKENYFIQACDEYDKRLRRYCALERIELPETGDVVRDGEAMLKKIPQDAWVVAMCVEGEMRSSRELAALLSDCAGGGRRKRTAGTQKAGSRSASPLLTVCWTRRAPTPIPSCWKT